MAGPIEFSATEAAIIFAVLGLAPPFVVAAIGSAVHARIAMHNGEPVRPVMLFLKWWGLCTTAWLGAWILGALFSGG
ncbi:MAG TPA: hypothetical protein VEV43_03790 [Actinomycetota bacterium]|nr:hypothetical protein [Actinomycetota bacterium]